MGIWFGGKEERVCEEGEGEESKGGGEEGPVGEEGGDEGVELFEDVGGGHCCVHCGRRGEVRGEGVRYV